MCVRETIKAGDVGGSGKNERGGEAKRYKIFQDIFTENDYWQALEAECCALTTAARDTMLMEENSKTPHNDLVRNISTNIELLFTSSGQLEPVWGLVTILSNK